MLLLIARRTLVEESRYQLFAMYSARQNSEAKAMFYFTAPPLDYDRHDVERQKKILAEAFAGEGWEIPRMLKGMWDAPDFYFDPLSLVQMDSWSKGRVVLLGDAGYIVPRLCLVRARAWRWWEPMCWPESSRRHLEITIQRLPTMKRRCGNMSG